MTRVVDAGAGDTPARLFMGFDSVSRGMLANRAVRGGTMVGGGSSSINIEVCQSVSELAEALEIDSSVSVNFLTTFNATAKMRFMNSLNVTETNVTVVVYVRNGLGRYEADDVALRPDRTPPADDAAARTFAREFGDSYISAASQGGEYFAVYAFRSTSRTEQRSLVASLQAGGRSGGVAFNSDTQLKLTNLRRQSNVRSNFRQGMTGVTGIELPDETEMIDFARKFPTKTMNSPVTTDLEIKHYETVPNFGDGFGKVIANRRYFADPNSGLLLRLARLESVEEQIDLLQSVYQVYGFNGDDALDALSPRVEADLRKVRTQIHGWERDPTQSFVEPELPSLAEGMPELDFDEGQTASFGPDTGRNFDFMPVGNAFLNRVRIHSIRLTPGWWGNYHVVLQLEVEYVDGDGKTWKAVHGLGNEENQGGAFNLNGRFPTKVRVGHGGLIDSLRIESGNRHVAAGGPGGTIDTWEPKDDEVVLGFAGRAGGALDQIRIIHATLKPATYR